MNFKNHINSDKRYYNSKIQINAIFILIKSFAKMFNSFIISRNVWQWAVWTKRKSHVQFLEQKKMSNSKNNEDFLHTLNLKKVPLIFLCFTNVKNHLTIIFFSPSFSENNIKNKKKNKIETQKRINTSQTFWPENSQKGRGDAPVSVARSHQMAALSDVGGKVSRWVELNRPFCRPLLCSLGGVAWSCTMGSVFLL